MREILFQGKRVDNGKWVEGFYYEDIAGKSVILSRPFDFGYADALDVDPETVRQFTGLRDRTKLDELTAVEQVDWLCKHEGSEWIGKKIFEGDIVKARNTFHDKDGIFVVRWAEENGFYFTDDCGTNWHHDHLTDIEVIGNVFDNSELVRK